MLLGRRCGRVTDVLMSLAEGPPGRADLARHRAITLQAGSHTSGPGTRSGPLLASPQVRLHVTDFADPLRSDLGSSQVLTMQVKAQRRLRKLDLGRWPP